MKIKKYLKWVVSNSIELIAASALVASIFITTINAVTRYTLRYTWNPGTDITILCFAWVVFCGAAAAYKRKLHFGIDFAIAHIPERIRRFIELPTHLLVIFILAYATYLSFNLATHTGGKIFTNTKISYFWYDLSAVVGFAYMTGCEIFHTITNFKDSFLHKEGKL